MDEDEPDEVLDLAAVRRSDAELDDIAAGGPGDDDALARLLVAWRRSGRGVETVAIDYSDVELADLYVRMTPDGLLFIGIGDTPIPNSPAELDDEREPQNVRGVLLDRDQRRELAYKLLAIDES